MLSTLHWNASNFIYLHMGKNFIKHLISSGNIQRSPDTVHQNNRYPHERKRVVRVCVYPYARFFYMHDDTSSSPGQQIKAN